jgi:hypothetical protein
MRISVPIASFVLLLLSTDWRRRGDGGVRLELFAVVEMVVEEAPIVFAVELGRKEEEEAAGAEKETIFELGGSVVGIVEL